MILDHKFGSNCDQDLPRRRWLGDTAIFPALVLIGIVVMGTAAIATRATIVAIAPATAAIYSGVGIPVNLRDLSVDDVRVTTTQQPDSSGELLVTGEIANLRDHETATPNLRLALRNENGRELYIWTARAPKNRLGAHERVTFRARLASPPAGVRDVLVKFAAPGDKGLFTESPS
jgi:Protein of unknown function (DUF3426)